MKKIAIPTVNGLLSNHFGHCEKFTIVETDHNQIHSLVQIDPPEHQRGTFPFFLAKKGVDVVISAGMGARAIELFARHNIRVYAGASNESPESLVAKYLKGQLEDSQNLCDHDHKPHPCLLDEKAL
jgi:predicted Fe-Mo cluster-binding NifX family protein